MMQMGIAIDREKRSVGNQLGTLHCGAALGCPVVEEHLMWCLGFPSAQGVLPWDLGEYWHERCCQSRVVDLRHLKGGSAATQ